MTLLDESPVYLEKDSSEQVCCLRGIPCTNTPKYFMMLACGHAETICADHYSIAKSNGYIDGYPCRTKNKPHQIRGEKL